MLPAMKRIKAVSVAILVGTAASCVPALRLTPSDADVVLARQVLSAPDPGREGPFPVLPLYYGSGTDRHRPEYRDSVSLVTQSVDASKLVSLGSSEDSRNDYWGFTPEEMPLNARVWYPDGPGPFPLVLVVHGNHDMKDFSDPGYDYLGELLASRGYILASIDENFINGGIRGENDARGWFLLKHLELFQEFSREEGNPFFDKVDMGRVALMGHSRGGEAVANAAALLGVVIVLEIHVRLESVRRFGGLAFRVSYATKALLYSILLLAAIYWGIAGDFVDFWDAFLWLVAFVFIEMNVLGSHEKHQERAAASNGAG